ncbi:EpsG family protein [Pedobacter sp. PWIIR3]
MSIAALLPVGIRERKVLFLGICLILTLICGFRASITADYDVYLAKYLSIKNGESGEGMEFTYSIISNLVANSINHFNGLIFIYAMLSIGSFTYAAMKQTKSFLLVLPYYFSYYYFLHPMTQIREAVAASFLLVSLQFIKERKFINFLFVILIGSCFHVSLILFIPFYYILGRLNLSLKGAFALMILGVLVSQIHLLNLVLGFDLNSESYILSKIYMYKGTIEAGVGERTAGVYIIMIYLKLFFNFILRLKEKAISKHTKYYNVFLDLHFYGCLSYILLSDIHMVGGRVSELLSVVEIFLVPYFIYIFRPSIFGKILILFICAFQLIIALYFVHLSGPYKIGF